MNYHPVQVLLSAVGDKLNPQQVSGIINALTSVGYSWPRPGKETLLNKQQLAEYLCNALVAVEFVHPMLYYEFRLLVKTALLHIRSMNALKLLPLIQQRKAITAVHLAARVNVHRLYLLGYEYPDSWLKEMAIELGDKAYPTSFVKMHGAFEATRWLRLHRERCVEVPV